MSSPRPTKIKSVPTGEAQVFPADDEYTITSVPVDPIVTLPGQLSAHQAEEDQAVRPPQTNRVQNFVGGAQDAFGAWSISVVAGEYIMPQLMSGPLPEPYATMASVSATTANYLLGQVGKTWVCYDIRDVQKYFRELSGGCDNAAVCAFKAAL